jgi:uncharacterized protein YjbJ (UPF0337 family)
MDKDRVTGKVKEVEGRIERQTAEWTGDKKKQVHGAAKQAQGKVQNAWGKVKDITRDALNEGTDSGQIEDLEDTKELEPEPRLSRR